MSDEATLTLDGRSYRRTRTGWVDARTQLRVPDALRMRLDRLESQRPLAPPSEIDACLSMAQQAQEAGLLSRAEQLVRHALSYDPQHLGALSLLSSVLRERGLPQLALESTAAFAKAMYPPLRTSRAAALCDLGRWEEAAKLLGPVLAAGGSPEAFSVVHRIKSHRPDIYEG